MIQIQSKSQFTKVAERLQTERMGVRRAGPHLYEVTNKAKAHVYHVRFHRLDGRTFVSCDCPAEIRHNRAPLVCKHLAAAVIYVRALRGMREAAGARREQRLA